MARIPATMASITTTDRISDIFFHRTLFSQSGSCDITGYDTNIRRCACGAIHSADVCPACNNQHASFEEVALSTVLKYIEDIRYWFTTKAKDVMSSLAPPIKEFADEIEPVPVAVMAA